jgi:hypothetical protein
METATNTAREALKIIEQLYDETETPTPAEQPTAEALEKIVNAGTVTTLRNSDNLTIEGRSAYMKADRIQDPNRAEIAVHYNTSRNEKTSTGYFSVYVDISTPNQPRYFISDRFYPSVWNGSKFASYPMGALDLIEKHFLDQISKLIEADPAAIITAGQAAERRRRTSSALHKAKMALDDVVRGIDR